MRQIIFFLILIFGFSKGGAQITFETEYLGNSRYKVSQNDKSQRVGNSSGSAIVYQGGINIPVKMEENDQGQSNIWMIGAAGAVARLNNKNFAPGLVIDDILNVNINLIHRAPVNERWSYLAVAGAGVYAPTIRISEIRAGYILGNVAAVFIRTPKPNLEWGVGLALNNTLGYPMLFPAMYFNWNTDDRFAVKVQAMDGVETSVKYDLTDNVTLGLKAEIKGQMATLKQGGENKIFTHQYVVIALRPEIKLGEQVSIPIGLGIQANRNAQMNSRSLKSLFQSKDYYFDLSPYLSAGINVDF